MTKASDNQYPKVTFAESAAPGTPSSGLGYVYVSTGGTPYFVNDAGTETSMLGGAGGAVATDAIWDAAGDLAVGSGANTAARLAIGNAGGAVSRVNGAVAWNSGTAFPTAATGDRYWRTDLGLEFYYDGTRWLTTQVYTLTQSTYDVATYQPAPNPITIGRHSLWNNDFEPYFLKLYGETYVATTNDGSNYWSISFVGVITSTSYGSFNTSADSVATHTGHETTLNVAAGSTERGLVFSLGKTSAPGTIYWNYLVTYRLIGT